MVLDGLFKYYNALFTSGCRGKVVCFLFFSIMSLR